MDKLHRPTDRRAWGFSGTIDKIELTSAKPDVQDILSTDENEEARGNGGGEPSVHMGSDGVVHKATTGGNVQPDFPAEEEVTLEYLESLTKAQLFELAQAHEIELEAKSGDNKDVVFDELKEYYDV